MSDKAAKKKQYILDTARKVFAEKGFKSVTMKDIVDACEISRGGLYIYYDSTESIFEEIMQEASEKESAVLEELVKKNGSCGERLVWFLTEQKKEMLTGNSGMLVAFYEYLFYKMGGADGYPEAGNKAEKITEALASLIKAGVENGEFYTEDAVAEAKNIIYVVEGLKVASRTWGVTEKEIEDEFLFVLSGLIAEE